MSSVYNTYVNQDLRAEGRRRGRERHPRRAHEDRRRPVQVQTKLLPAPVFTLLNFIVSFIAFSCKIVLRFSAKVVGGGPDGQQGRCGRGRGGG